MTREFVPFLTQEAIERFQPSFEEYLLHHLERPTIDDTHKKKEQNEQDNTETAEHNVDILPPEKPSFGQLNIDMSPPHDRESKRMRARQKYQKACSTLRAIRYPRLSLLKKAEKTHYLNWMHKRMQLISQGKQDEEDFKKGEEKFVVSVSCYCILQWL